MKLTIRRKLVLFGGALGLMVTILLSIAYFYQTRYAVNHISKDSNTMLINSVGFSMENFTNEFEDILGQLEKSPELKSDITEDEKAKLETTMASLRSSKKDIFNIYFVSGNDDLAVSPKRIVKEEVNYKERKWYKDALNSNSFAWSDVYTDALTEKRVVTVSKAIFRDNKFQGIIGIDISTDSIMKYISQIKLDKGTYFAIIDSNNVVVSNPDDSLIGKPIAIENLQTELANREDGEVQYNSGSLRKSVVYATISQTNWKVLLIIDLKKNYVEALGMFKIILAIAIIIVVITLALARRLGIGITSDLTNLVEKISSLEEGQTITDNFQAKSEETAVIANQLDKITAKINTIVEATSDAIWEYDVVNDKLFISKKFKDITGYDFTDRTRGIGVLLDLINPRDIERMIFDYRNVVNLKGEMKKREARFKRADGEYIWLSVSAIVGQKNDSKATMIYGAISDVSEKKSRDEEIYNLAFYDTLTGLPNRRRVLDQLEFYMEKCKEDNSSVALILLNIDDFTKINNTLGSRVGDIYLKEVVNRLHVFNERKELYIGRVGGDDFAVLVANVVNKYTVKALAEEILEEFKKPLLIDGKMLITSITLGISIYPENGSEEEVLLRNADIAMLNADAMGGKKYKFFKEDMYNSFVRRLDIENCLRSADYDKEFRVFYQPQIDVSNYTLRGFEALIRWNSGTLGAVSPGEFIPISEEIGVIVPLGKWLVYRVFNDILKMKELGISFGRISINISAVQLMDVEFGAFIEEAIEKTGISCNDIELEITETSVINNIQYSKKVLDKLRQKGLKVVLDDFGTGYSSLSYLRNLPIEVLKIDKSFIDCIEYEGDNRSLINGIIGIAHDLKLEVVAEGVEVEGQVGILREMKCDCIQGYFFSKPIPFEEIYDFYHKLHKTNPF